MTEYITMTVSGMTFLIASVALRCLRLTRISARQVESVASPMSRAIQTTIGYAGGIYMTLVMLASFLQVEVPERTVIHGLAVEPLAFTAVILALIQPFFLVIWDMVKKR